MVVVVGVVLGVSRLAAIGGAMGSEEGLAAWRYLCCELVWSPTCMLVGAG